MIPDRDRMRVVVVVSHLGLGGAERQTLDLLRQLRGTPWAPVGVVCLSESAATHGDEVRALGYPLSVVPRVGAFDLARTWMLRRLLRHHAADVIHAVNWFATGYSVLARPRRARVVSSIRNSHLPAGKLRRLALVRLVRRSEGVLVNSERGRQFVMDACQVPPARIALVPNGIDVERLRSGAVAGALRHELGISAEVPVVLYVGRQARVKNIPRLLAVARTLLAASPDVRIVLAGDGLDRELVADTPLAGEPRLFCLGPRADVPSLLSDATVLVLTSDSEGMPNVVLEALALGLPVVSTAVGDLARIVPHGCGLLVPPDADALAAATRQVIANAPGYRRAARRHAASMSAIYSTRTMASRTVALWRAVLAHTRETVIDLQTPLNPVPGAGLE